MNLQKTKFIRIWVYRANQLIWGGQFGQEWSKAFIELSMNSDVNIIKYINEIAYSKRFEL